MHDASMSISCDVEGHVGMHRMEKQLFLISRQMLTSTSSACQGEKKRKKKLSEKQVKERHLTIFIKLKKNEINL